MTMARRPLVFATRNRGKVAELRALLADVDVVTIDEAQVRLGIVIADVIEDGITFAANADKKASAVALATGWPALADDSGLEVDALGGAPGVYSARYADAAPGADHDAANNAKLLVALADVPVAARTARFRCHLTLRDPAGSLRFDASGVCDGVILTSPRGTGGFGYDPLFLLPDLGLTFGELDAGIKNQRSHRAQAMRQLAATARAYLATSP